MKNSKEEKLKKILELIHDVINEARNYSYGKNERVAELLSSVENVSSLVLNECDVDEEIVLFELMRYEHNYHGGKRKFSKYLFESF